MSLRTYSRAARTTALFALFAAAACKKDAPAPVAAPHGDGSRAPASAPPSPPAAASAPAPSIAPAGAAAGAPSSEFPPLPTRELLPTTSGNIAFGNLAGDAENAEKLLAATPNNAELMMRVVPVLLMHGKTAGILRDYDRALTLAEGAVKLLPKSPEAWSALSQVHATLHRFDEAAADLKRVEALGAKGSRLDASRASLLQATGRLKEARPILEKLAAEAPGLDTLGALATLEADEGHVVEAERRFHEALATFKSVSPFPLVWLWFQQGLMWQNEGRMARARQLFAAAHERLPEDVAVSAHLASAEAATGERGHAVVLLRQIVATSDDPEYLGQLSQLLREDKATEEADRLRTQAAARYEELLKKHPAAFAEHAARFWLGPGGDAKKAVPLAKLNLERRKTATAYELLLESRMGAREPAAATCQLAQGALAPPARPTPRLRLLAARAFTDCGQKDRADAELRAITPAPEAAAAAAASAAIAAPAPAAPSAPASPPTPAAPAPAK